MHTCQYVFYLSCFIVFYNYVGYALIVYTINLLKRTQSAGGTMEYYPGVSFIVAAYNEEDVIEAKILNSLQQNYPSSKIEFIFITDGSTDNSTSIIKKHPVIQLMHEPERKGKSSALNRAVQKANYTILIISDANTVLNDNAVRYIASHYRNENIGGVAGEKRVVSSLHNISEVGAGEGLYWKYESFLKKIDSKFYSVVGAAGELFSVRKNLFEPLPANVILDDFVISLKVAQKGYRIAYEPMAYATELSSISYTDEQKRKIRIAAGGFQAMVILSSLFLFWKHFKLTFLYISHRVLRWTLSPVCLILIFISNVVLISYMPTPAYVTVFVVQLSFYALSFISKYIPANSKFRVFKFTYYFVFMNFSVILGFFRFLFGKQTVAWEKVKRIKV